MSIDTIKYRPLKDLNWNAEAFFSPLDGDANGRCTVVVGGASKEYGQLLFCGQISTVTQEGDVLTAKFRTEELRKMDVMDVPTFLLIPKEGEPEMGDIGILDQKSTLIGAMVSHLSRPIGGLGAYPPPKKSKQA